MTAPPPTSLLNPTFLRLLERLTVHLQGRVRGDRMGERRSKRRGTGGDFADMRPYTSGDDLRHLDWPSFARLDTLFVRLYEEPREHTLNLLIDSSASMACGKADFTRQLAAALGYIALRGQDRVGLFLLGDRLRGTLGPLRGKPAIHRMLQWLETIAFGGTTDLERAVRGFVATRARGTVVVLSDFLVPEGRVESLRILAGRRTQVVVLHILAPEERLPPLGQELTFVDAESGEELQVAVDRQTQAAYLAELTALTDELRQTCRAYGLTWVDVDAGMPLEHLFLGPLRRQGVLDRLGRA
ncbi:MAG: DUF58 domain-containing protein [Myxococcota bacterium]